jgi:outer membrane protein TolC
MHLSRLHRAITKTLVVLTLCLNAQRLVAQRTRDTLFLDELQRAAEVADRRGSQVPLLAAQSMQRLASLRTERLPSLTATGSAQYVSDVVSVGAVLPSRTVGAPANDQYDAYLTVRQSVLDPTRSARAAIERATNAESAARIRTALWQQRSLVTDAFFGALHRNSQISSLDAAIADLNARRAVAETRVSAGAALPSELLLIEAELVRRRQSRDELTSDRDASLALLSALTDTPLTAGAALAVRAPPAGSLVPRTADSVRARPEFAQFDRARDAIAARQEAASALDRPRLSAFGRTGYGRPGLNPLNRSFDTYWLAGLQVDWTPWNWGRTRRDIEVQRLQSDVIRSEEVAFRDAIGRAALTQRAQIASLEHGIAADDAIVAIRARILRETRLRFDEGEVSSADYIARLTEHLVAQFDRDTRRVRLDEARARYLTIIGLEVR